MTKVIPLKDLGTADLIVDAVYESSGDGSLAGEPISNLLPGTANLGGFRASGRGKGKRFVVLFTTGESRDWPDSIDPNTGRFVYYGDNRSPGHELHETPLGGNRILRTVFDQLHVASPDRKLIPPFFVFARRVTPKCSRSVQFKGLAVPGHPGLSPTEDLVAVWKTAQNQRFQNYRSVFTILDAGVVHRAWINDLIGGAALSGNAPPAWAEWVTTGVYRPLTSEPTTVIRSFGEQTPDTPVKVEILATVYEHFKNWPRGFEFFAARLFQMQDQRVLVDEITRGVVDGGRDAVGRYLLGLPHDPVYAEFSLEAKCYAPPISGMKASTVGVKEVSRLISRLC
jgi:hypothetical protein